MLFRVCSVYAVHSDPVFFIAQPKTMPKTIRPKASVATVGIALPKANQPGKRTRAKSKEEAKLACQKPVVCQNLFKRKPLKKISSTSVAGTGSQTEPQREQCQRVSCPRRSDRVVSTRLRREPP